VDFRSSLPFTVGIDYNLRWSYSQAQRDFDSIASVSGVDTSNALLEDSDLLGLANVLGAQLVLTTTAQSQECSGGIIRLDEPSDVFLILQS
jgi:hypothetical protein